MLRGRLAAHDRRELPLDGRLAAAVAIVVVDSDAELHDGDPLVPEQIDLSMLPGEDARGIDGRMVGVAGGPAFLLCRRTSRLRRHAGQWALPGTRVDDVEEPVFAWS